MKGYLPNRITFLLITILTVSAGEVYGQSVRYNGSAQYASGSYYFTQQTGSFYFSNGLSFSQNGYRLSVTLPYVYQTTPWISYTGTSGGFIPTGGPNNRQFDGKSDSGNGMGSGSGRGSGKVDPGDTDSVSYAQTAFGDPSVNLQFPVYDTPAGQTVIIGDIGIKIPIADPNSGYGTGAWDIGAGFTVLKRLDQYVLLLSGSYWIMGDMDELDFNNTITYNAAIGRSFSDGKFLSTASIMGSTRIIDEVDPPFSFGGSFGWQINSLINISSNFTAGLSESSSDYSFGIGWSLRL